MCGIGNTSGRNTRKRTLNPNTDTTRRKKAKVTIPPVIPLMGLELETIPDAQGQPKVMGKWTGDKEKKHPDSLNIRNTNEANNCYDTYSNSRTQHNSIN